MTPKNDAPPARPPDVITTLEAQLDRMAQQLDDLLLLVPQLAAELAEALDDRDRLLAACGEAIDALEDPVRGDDPRRILIHAVAGLRTDIERVEVGT